MLSIELLGDRVGRAHDRVAAVDDLVPAVDVEHERAGTLHHVRERADRRVAGRLDRDAGQQALHEVPEVLLVLRPCLLVGVGHVDRDEPSRLERVGRVALGVARVAEHLERALEHAQVEVRDAHVRVVVASDELHRLERAGTGDPDLGVRLLDGAGPRVHVADPEVLAHPLERAGRRPGLDDEVVRLLEPLAGVRRVDRERVVLRAAADDHAGDQASAADVVDDRELLGDARRRVVERERVADDRDLHALRLARERRRHEVGRRHQAVRVLVVLVDAHAVEAELFGVHELVEVAVVELRADGGVVQRVRARHPRGSVVRRVEPDVWHQVEREEPHASPFVVGQQANGRRSARAERTDATGTLA